MLLSDLFEQLTYGELSQLSITGNGTRIDNEDYPKMVAHINLALSNLSTRFNMLQKEIIIQQYDHITDYYLRPQFAVNSGSSETYKYLVDTAEDPFLGDVVTVQEIYDELGTEVYINKNVLNSIYTPAFDTIQIPYPVSTNAISVIYRAKHRKLVVGSSTDLETIEVNIPDFLIVPMSYFIASNLTGPIGESGLNESNNYINKYEKAIQIIEMQGLFNRDNMEVDNITSQGWG